MCTSIVVNRRKTIIGWNLDLLDMEYRVRPSEDGVFIEINDAREGWMPLFGGNARALQMPGDFFHGFSGLAVDDAAFTGMPAYVK